MRYKPGYKQEKRKELLQISGQLAKQQGFAATGVDGFMKAAGVTSGAFYSHFSSKHELLKALVEAELQQSLAMWQENPHDDPADWIEFELNRYLSPLHAEKPEYGCVLPALSSEISRAEEDIKQVYEAELIRGIQLFEKHLGNQDQAWAVLCQMVGSILMARSVASPELKIRILESSKLFLLSQITLRTA